MIVTIPQRGIHCASNRSIKRFIHLYLDGIINVLEIGFYLCDECSFTSYLASISVCHFETGQIWAGVRFCTPIPLPESDRVTRGTTQSGSFYK